MGAGVDGDQPTAAELLGGLDLAGPAACRAGLGHRALLGPRAPAEVAGLGAGDLRVHLLSGYHVLEVHVDLDADVVAGPWPAAHAATSAAATSEENVEYVAATSAEDAVDEVETEYVGDVVDVGEVVPGEATGAKVRPDALVAEAVETGPLVIVHQDLVGLGQLLELLLRGLRVVGVRVRVILLGQLAVRLLDLVLGRYLLHAQDIVVVPLLHAFHPADRLLTPPRSDPGGMRRAITIIPRLPRWCSRRPPRRRRWCFRLGRRRSRRPKRPPRGRRPPGPAAGRRWRTSPGRPRRIPC